MNLLLNIIWLILGGFIVVISYLLDGFDVKEMRRRGIQLASMEIKARNFSASLSS